MWSILAEFERKAADEHRIQWNGSYEVIMGLVTFLWPYKGHFLLQQDCQAYRGMKVLKWPTNPRKTWSKCTSWGFTSWHIFWTDLLSCSWSSRQTFFLQIQHFFGKTQFYLCLPLPGWEQQVLTWGACHDLLLFVNHSVCRLYAHYKIGPWIFLIPHSSFSKTSLQNFSKESLLYM